MGKVENDDRADWREVWALFPDDVAYVWRGALHAAIVAESLELSAEKPTWSPDGNRIAFSSVSEIHGMLTDGSGETTLSSSSGYDRDPAWVASAHDNEAEVAILKHDQTRGLEFVKRGVQSKPGY